MFEDMRHFREHYDRGAQQLLVREIVRVIAAAPLFTPTMPRSGKAFSVKMTNCGPLGWVSDKELGYRYQPTHPVTGKPWPDMPKLLRDLWQEVAGYPAPPQACLVNFYGAGAKMGPH
ncbi:MAG: alpha-ketoglutarate-dependent dioxygenase AlkB, partial [Methyloligellaceae bacterium]